MTKPKYYGDCCLCMSPLLDIEDLSDEICPTCHQWLREETDRCAKERLDYERRTEKSC